VGGCASNETVAVCAPTSKPNHCTSNTHPTCGSLPGPPVPMTLPSILTVPLLPPAAAPAFGTNTVMVNSRRPAATSACPVRRHPRRIIVSPLSLLLDNCMELKVQDAPHSARNQCPTYAQLPKPVRESTLDVVTRLRHRTKLSDWLGPSWAGLDSPMGACFLHSSDGGQERPRSCQRLDRARVEGGRHRPSPHRRLAPPGPCRRRVPRDRRRGDAHRSTGRRDRSQDDRRRPHEGVRRDSPDRLLAHMAREREGARQLLPP